MEIQEALQWTDRLLLKTTGKHLDSLQRAILEGAWQGKGYKDIADEYHCTGDHVRKSASDLWKLLSELLGEDVKKKNVRSLIEKGAPNFVSLVKCSEIKQQLEIVVLVSVPATNLLLNLPKITLVLSRTFLNSSKQHFGYSMPSHCQD